MAVYINGKKIGRNALCPCGSGRKFKRCHGATDPAKSASAPGPEPIPDAVHKEIERQRRYHEAAEHQRRQQQGLGRPIISTEHNGFRFVAVGRKLHWSRNWKTFHDFLFDYIKQVLGPDWGNSELRKPFEERHPIIQWYDYLCRYQREFIKQPGKVDSAPMIGAVQAYLGLAYYLYLIAHNIKDISTRLIQRLKDPKGFRGAFYEIYVAAIFIKAGFELEFENEDDRSTSHCEFTAIAPLTTRRFSVEAKVRQYGGPGGQADPSQASPMLRVGRQLARALKKKAKCERVIFIDVNVPDLVRETDKAAWMKRALAALRKMENLEVGGAPADPAYVLVTNHPYTYDLEGTEFRSSILAEGFKIPDFRADSEFPTILAAVEARERHQEMHDLLKFLRHSLEIPSTFGGENPEFAFEENAPPRLMVGQVYLVPDSDGKEVPGELIDAVVLEQESQAVGIYRLKNGTTVIVKNPLTKDELSAYQAHPETFFGVVKRAKREIKDALDAYDFLYESYRHTSKERLLEFMRDHPDIGHLAGLQQENLAKIYCERMAYVILNVAEKRI